MTDEDRKFNGHLIEDLCRLGESVVKEFRPNSPTAEQAEQDQRRLRDLHDAVSPREFGDPEVYGGDE